MFKSFFAKKGLVTVIIVALIILVGAPQPAEAFIHKKIIKAITAVVSVVVAVVATVTAPITMPIAAITGNREPFRCWLHDIGSPLGASGSCPGGASPVPGVGTVSTQPLFGTQSGISGSQPIPGTCSIFPAAPGCPQRGASPFPGVTGGTPTFPGTPSTFVPSVDPGVPATPAPVVPLPPPPPPPQLFTSVSRPIEVTFLNDRPATTNDTSISLTTDYGGARIVTLVLSTTNIRGATLSAIFDNVTQASKSVSSLPAQVNFKLRLSGSVPTGIYPFVINAIDGTQTKAIAGTLKVENLDPRTREQ